MIDLDAAQDVIDLDDRRPVTSRPGVTRPAPDLTVDLDLGVVTGSDPGSGPTARRLRTRTVLVAAAVLVAVAGGGGTALALTVGGSSDHGSDRLAAAAPDSVSGNAEPVGVDPVPPVSSVTDPAVAPAAAGGTAAADAGTAGTTPAAGGKPAAPVTQQTTPHAAVPELHITPPVDPLLGMVGEQFALVLATDAGGAVTWQVTGGSLPDGVELSGNQLSGVPSEAGTHDVRLTVRDTAGATATTTLTITVNPAAEELAISDPVPGT